MNDGYLGENVHMCVSAPTHPHACVGINRVADGACGQGGQNSV